MSAELFFSLIALISGFIVGCALYELLKKERAYFETIKEQIGRHSRLSHIWDRDVETVPTKLVMEIIDNRRKY